MAARHVTIAAGAALLLLGASTARAESPRLHGSALGARALSGHQKRELGFGLAGLGAAELPLASMLGVQAELGALWLSDRDDPEDPRLAPQGSGSALHAALGARLAPLGAPGGPWLSAAGGLALTGGLTRPMFDVMIGYDFALAKGRLGVGPTAGLYHVFQPSSELRPADANIVLAGIHVVLDPVGRKRDGDRDQDGIADSLDRCPDVAEDRDDFQDADGCPDPDNDGDGIVDSLDRCPVAPEDRDGFKDADGCPDPDNDDDTIPDLRDRCPNEPEDFDNVEDHDGCPDIDNDHDGVIDAKDLCPYEPETKNGYADDDGCPDSEQVRVVGDKILLDDRVHFATNSAKIRPESHALLERVAKLILDNPTYVHVQVEGHTDERGPEWFNEKLSQERAESVLEFLVKNNVERSRLSAKGYGSSRPRADKQSERGWFLNRRVEFDILREVRAVEPAPSPAKEQSSEGGGQ